MTLDKSHVNGREHRQQRQRPQTRKVGAEHYLIPSPNFKEQWIESPVDIGSLETIDTVQGVINDATDMMALKTSVRWVTGEIGRATCQRSD